MQLAYDYEKLHPSSVIDFNAEWQALAPSIINLSKKQKKYSDSYTVLENEG